MTDPTQNGRFTAGRRRRRVYRRLFDWKEARARHAKGETFASIARSLGVDRRSVARVVYLPKRYVEEATQEQIDALVRDRKKVPCPRCSRPMSEKASLCRDCANELRLAPMTLRHVPGTPGNSRIELRDVELNRIVEVDGDWGVLTRSNGRCLARHRLVDFFELPAECIHERTRVRVAPTTEVLVEGVAEGEEEIE